MTSFYYGAENIKYMAIPFIGMGFTLTVHITTQKAVRTIKLLEILSKKCSVLVFVSLGGFIPGRLSYWNNIWLQNFT